MSESKKSSSNNGIGFFGLLGIAFIVLKLCKLITWSWWYVLLPLYGWIVLAILVFGSLIVWAIWKDKKDDKARAERIRQLNNPNNPKKVSKFQERLEEMQKQQKYNNN